MDHVKKQKVPMSENLLISIVDDDESIREAVKNLVKSVGYRVEAFASAKEDSDE